MKESEQVRRLHEEKKEKVCVKLFHICFDCTNHLPWCLVFLGMGNQIKANDENAR